MQFCAPNCCGLVKKSCHTFSTPVIFCLACIEFAAQIYALGYRHSFLFLRGEGYGVRRTFRRDFMKFQIVSDSSCEFQPEDIAQCGITVVSFYVSFDGDVYYREGKEIGRAHV